MQKMAKRESDRVKDADKVRALDPTTRRRRLAKALDTLEQDNFHDDPHANLIWNKNAPKFSEDGTHSGTKKYRAEQTKLKFRKSLQALLDEEMALHADCNYNSAKSPPSKLPQRQTCSVCGFLSNYVCVLCGSKYCTIKCLGIHADTRCLKWTV